MQTVYVDTFLCVNLFIDYIILYAVRRTLRINSKAFRLLLGALVAAVCAFGVFLPFYTKVFSVFYRLITAAISVFISFGKSKLKSFILRISAFLGISTAFSGVVVLVWLIFKPTGVVIYNDAVYFDLSPVMLILCTILAFISLSVYERLKSKIKPEVRIHRVTVVSENTEYSFCSMVDTGCNLREPFSGLPVIVAEKELVDFKDIPENKLRLVPYKTLSGEGMLKAFKPNKTLIDGKEIKSGCYIGVSDGKLTNEIKSLMGKEITEGL